MAIDIQQPNYSGLVALAGKSAPLNIQPTGALGLQALQQVQANQASLRDDAARRMALQQQGQMGLLSNITQNRALDMQNANQQQQGLLAQKEMGLKQAQMGIQAGQFQDEMALKQAQLGQQGSQYQGEMDLKNRLLAEETAKRQMVQLMSEKKQDLHDKGAFASYGLLAMSGAKTPEEANQIRTSILKEAGDKGYMSEDELKAAAQMPLSQFQNGLKYKVVQMGLVKEHKMMVEASKPAPDKSGTQISFNPDGSIASYSSMPTQGTRSEIQKDIKNNEKAMSQLDKIQEGYDPDFFTYRNQAGASLSKEAEKAKGIPIWENITNLAAGAVTGKDPEQRAEFLKKRTQYINNLEQVFLAFKKEMTGTAAGPTEIENIRKSTLNGDMSPSEAVGAMDQLRSKYGTMSSIDKKAISQGIDVTPNSNEALVQRLKSIKNPDGSSKYSDAEINNYLKGSK